MKRPSIQKFYRQALLQANAKLLFGLAQDVANSRGGEATAAMARLEHSGLSSSSYALKTDSGGLIRRIPIGELANALARRCRDMRRALRRARIRSDSRRPFWLNRRMLGDQPHWFLPLVWAISTGEPYPRPGYPLLERLITVGLLICGVIPGLICLVMLSRQRRSRFQDLDHLAQHWRALGAPQPNSVFMLLMLPRSATESAS
jgi:hypothetical protein